jgi:hypothetical protein
LAILGAVMGVGQLCYGVWLLGQAEPSKKFVGYVMQAGGLGWLGAAATFYFASGYDWALIAGLGVLFAASSIGAVNGMRYMKTQGDAQS